jgi:hypothetical protein
MTEWHPLFTERRAMEKMGPGHRRLHVAFSKLHHRVFMALWPDIDKHPSKLLRPWAWVWRQYRKTWPR